MRLCGEMRIAAARSKGKRVIAWPLRAHVLSVEGKTQVMVWAPKSLHKHAVDRNRLRRLMREAYRLNCQPLKQLEALHIAIYNMDKELPDYAQIDRAMSKLIAKIIASTHTSDSVTPPVNTSAKFG